MNDKQNEDNRQSGGINVEKSNVRIGRDAVGRDKYERHEYHKEESFLEWEEFYSGGCLAKVLIVLGTITIIIGMLIFFGTVLMGFGGGMEGIFSMGAVGFGVALVGMLIQVLGRAMARHSAYRKRRNSQRR